MKLSVISGNQAKTWLESVNSEWVFKYLCLLPLVELWLNLNLSYCFSFLLQTWFLGLTSQNTFIHLWCDWLGVCVSIFGMYSDPYSGTLLPMLKTWMWRGADSCTLPATHIRTALVNPAICAWEIRCILHTISTYSASFSFSPLPRSLSERVAPNSH